MTPDTRLQHIEAYSATYDSNKEALVIIAKLKVEIPEEMERLDKMIALINEQQPILEKLIKELVEG